MKIIPTAIPKLPAIRLAKSFRESTGWCLVSNPKGPLFVAISDWSASADHSFKRVLEVIQTHGDVRCISRPHVEDDLVPLHFDIQRQFRTLRLRKPLDRGPTLVWLHDGAHESLAPNDDSATFLANQLVHDREDHPVNSPLDHQLPFGSARRGHAVNFHNVLPGAWFLNGHYIHFVPMSGSAIKIVLPPSSSDAAHSPPLIRDLRRVLNLFAILERSVTLSENSGR